jgi:hypothetical protein
MRALPTSAEPKSSANVPASSYMPAGHLATQQDVAALRAFFFGQTLLHSIKIVPPILMEAPSWTAPTNMLYGPFDRRPRHFICYSYLCLSKGRSFTGYESWLDVS